MIPKTVLDSKSKKLLVNRKYLVVSFGAFQCFWKIQGEICWEKSRTIFGLNATKASKNR
jgi:hypothetical protein